MNNLEQIKEQASQRVKVIQSLEEYDNVRVEYLGKQGIITAQMKTLGSLADDERKDFGAKLNELKQYITAQLEIKKEQLDEAHINEKLASEKIDITLPGRINQPGKIHPISQVIDELICIFGNMGFSVIGGPEIEDDYHNFTALNIPDNHPARQMHDTFYLPDNEEGKKMLLRTHTSSVQIRLMETEKPPFKVIVPGRTYRCDFDMTHTPMFHQVEGLVIEKNIHMGHLKWCIMEFLKTFFEIDNLPVRFRANFFPFTEPSAEVDIGCLRQDGELKIGAGNDWLEILGCGMVHPNVLKNVGINPDEYQGFAFGMGIERIAMLKYGIADLRTFFEGDIRWLNHYGFSAFDIPSLVGGLSR